MSRDPYHDLKRDVQHNLNAAYTLISSYERISSSGQNKSAPESIEAKEELLGSLGLLEADIEDLEECVRVVEQSGSRWGLDLGEVAERRRFVTRVKREVEDIRARSSASPHSGQPKSDPRLPNRGDVRQSPRDEEDADEAQRWEREGQQVLMQRQDQTLGVISGTLSTLASQAGLIGREVGEQSEMLDGLSYNVDSTQSRLTKVSKTLQDFIRRNEETRSSWCIGILIVILIILLLAVLLT